MVLMNTMLVIANSTTHLFDSTQELKSSFKSNWYAENEDGPGKSELSQSMNGDKKNEGSEFGVVHQGADNFIKSNDGTIDFEELRNWYAEKEDGAAGKSELSQSMTGDKKYEGSEFGVVHQGAVQSVRNKGPGGEVDEAGGQAPELGAKFTMFTLLRNMNEDLKANADQEQAALKIRLGSPKLELTRKSGRFFSETDALASWTKLVPPHNVIVFAADTATCDFVKRRYAFRCELDTQCMNQDYQRPEIGCVWKRAVQLSSTELMSYVNADIMLFEDFTDTIKAVSNQLGNSHFVLVGKRTDQEPVPNPIELDSERDELYQAAQTRTAHNSGAMDYWVFRRSVLDLVPRTYKTFMPFLAGVYRWDNVLLSKFILSDNVTVVDSTKAITALHIDSPRQVKQWERNGAAYNEALNLQLASQYKIGSVDYADKVLAGKCGPYAKRFFGLDCRLVENEARHSAAIPAALKGIRQWNAYQMEAHEAAAAQLAGLAVDKVALTAENAELRGRLAIYRNAARDGASLVPEAAAAGKKLRGPVRGDGPRTAGAEPLPG
jgi:hypothetical protein